MTHGEYLTPSPETSSANDSVICGLRFTKSEKLRCQRSEPSPACARILMLSLVTVQTLLLCSAPEKTFPLIVPLPLIFHFSSGGSSSILLDGSAILVLSERI